MENMRLRKATWQAPFVAMVRGIVGGVLLYASVAKAISPEDTYHAARVWVIDSNIAASLVTPLIILFEYILGSWLITGLHQRKALSTALATFLGFAIFHAILLRSAVFGSCGCGLPKALIPNHLVGIFFNFAIAASCAFTIAVSAVSRDIRLIKTKI